MRLKMKKIINKYKNYHPSKWEALTYLTIPIFIGLLTATGSGGDIYFLINIGRYILNHGFFNIDPFTIHDGLNVVVQQWIPDILFYKAYDLFGKIGIYTIVNLCNIYFVFITYKLLMLVTEKRRNLSVAFTMVIALVFSLQFVSSRPQMFSYPLLMTELYFLEKYFKNGNWKDLIPLPIISLILINCHASMWLMLFCMWLPFLLNTFKYKIGKVESTRKEKKHLLIFGILMFIVGFINPYGYKSMSYVLTSYGVSEINDLVFEMQPISIHSVLGIIIYVIIFSIILFYVINKNVKKIESRYIFLFLGSLYLSLASYRSYIFIILTSIYPIAIQIKDSFYYIKEKKNYKYKNLFISMVLLFIVVPYIFISKNKLYIMAADYLDGTNYLYKNEKNNLKNIRLYCNYGRCNYSEWLGIKGYMDSRAEIFLKANNKKEDIFKELYYLQKGKIYYKDFLNKYNFNYLFVDENDYLYQMLLHDEEYDQIYSNYTRKKDYKLGIGKEESVKYILFKKK